MNCIHLPDPLVEDLDASRSNAEDEPQRCDPEGGCAKTWPATRCRPGFRPADLERWMREPLSDTTEQVPDFDAIRAEMNAAMRKRASRQARR